MYTIRIVPRFIKLINFFLSFFSIAVECKAPKKKRILLQHHITFKSMDCRKLKRFRFEYISSFP